MKRTNIYLDDEQDRLLRHLSIEEGRSPTDIVREALDEYLARRGLDATSQVHGPSRQIPAGEWRGKFNEALAKIRAGVPPSLGADEIEAEITAAHEEVRRGTM